MLFLLLLLQRCVTVYVLLYLDEYFQRVLRACILFFLLQYVANNSICDDIIAQYSTNPVQWVSVAKKLF